jgi:hypothetical protein
MRKVDLDTATVDPTKLCELNRKELTLAYAIYHVMESKLWDFANDHDAFQDPKWIARNKLVTKALDIIGAIYIHQFPEDCFVWEFRGCLRSLGNDVEGMDIEFADDNLSHYDIEKSIERTLGTDGIMMDSESSWFFVNTTDIRKEGLERFLKSSFPRLEFSVTPADDDHSDGRPPTIGNWGASARIVADAKVEVIIAMPELTPKPEAEIDKLLEQAEVALRKTGMNSVDAIERLMNYMDLWSAGVTDLSKKK